nr:cupin domain-containing protein [Actibacterium sp. 188UL27-1]
MEPGSRSSNLHWHASEDEFVYVLSGTITLVEGDIRTQMMPGMAATFKAGHPVGHQLENCSDQPVTYLVVGTRSHDDVVTYPETGNIQTVKNGIKTLRDRHGTILKCSGS